MDKRMEIGSFFEEGVYIEDKGSQACSDKNICMVSSGREAISVVLDVIEEKKQNIIKKCILPLYTCDTVIIPFQEREWDIYFYHIDKNLIVKKDQFYKLIHEVKPSVLLMHPYYGSDTIANVRDVIKKAQNEWGMIFIEDMTQTLGLFGEVSGADYYVGSLRKWFAIPDGGFAYGKENMQIKLEKKNNDFVNLKRQAQRQKKRYLEGDERVSKEEFLAMNRQAEEMLYKQDTIFGMSEYSRRFLGGTDVVAALETRTENGQYLDSCIRAMKNIRPVLDDKTQGYLYYPIYVEDRDELQAVLKNEDIFAPVLWPIDPMIEDELDGETRYIYDHLLALPCDQRYSIQDMERVIHCLRAYDGQCKEDVR